MACHGTSEGEKLKKHLGLAEKSFITMSERDQAKIGGRLMEIIHTLSDGAVVPLLNFCLEECHVRELCLLKGIKNTDPSSSQLKIMKCKKEEPKEEPNDEPIAEPEDELLEDSDVDERMAEANADIEAGVWNTRKKGHGNEVANEKLEIKDSEKEKTKLKPKTEWRKRKANSVGVKRRYLSATCPTCGKKFTQKGGMQKHREAVHLGVKYACQICDSLFTSKWWVKEHIRTVHKGSKIKNNA